MPDSGTHPRNHDTPKDLCDDDLFDPERVTAAREQMLPNDQVENLSSIFQCVGDPTRIKILRALMSSELCVCDLAQVLGISVSAVSHQLRTLRNLSLVKYRREGRMAYYSIDDEHVHSLLATGLEHIRHST